MKLSQQDADLFFKLMWGLQFYVNQKKRVLTGIKSVDEYAKCSSSDKLAVRDVLWKNANLIDSYVQENPDALSPEELDIIGKWKRFVSGTFQIFRFLKKHAIFIGEKSQVYAVLGLYDSLENMFSGQPLPVMVQAVLLPFKGQIIYDGLLRGYNVIFGGGIRSDLNEEYMAAKQNNRIITTLEPELAEPPQSTRKDKSAPGLEPAVVQVVQASEQLKGGSAVQNAAFGLLRASARLAQAAVQQPDDLQELWRLEQQIRRALTRLQTTLERAE